MLASANTSSNTDTSAATQRSPWRTLIEIALVFAIFFLHGAWPTPDLNETGYLAKAAHFWNHNAFANDFFCNTGDAHAVFYWAFGWLTTIGLSLDSVAWIGRIVTWLMLAVAWRGLSHTVLSKPWVAVLSAELFVLLTEQTHMAGEWIIGGIEAKGFAWAFVLWAMQSMIRDRWNLAWLLLGIATSFHVVVGGWAAVCLGIAWLTSPDSRAGLVAMLPGLIGFAILAAPGLWFAYKLNDGADWDTIAAANKIQVFERLPHHLFPLAFEVGYVPRHLLLWALMFILCCVTLITPRQRRLRQFVFATMGLAAISFVLAWIASTGPTSADSESSATKFAASLLRFYWSRLSDIVVPIGVTLFGLQFVLSQWPARKTVGRWLMAGLLTISAYDLWNQARHLSWLPPSWGTVTTRSDRMMASGDDWRDVCRWVAEDNHTPLDAVFITPLYANTFKWYTSRAEAGTWKDMPQDAKSVAEWWQRINELYATGSQNPDDRWRNSLAELGWQHLQELSTKYGASFAIVEIVPDKPRLEAQPIYENKSYSVYRLNIAK
jgi:hypothetical protein